MLLSVAAAAAVGAAAAVLVTTGLRRKERSVLSSLASRGTGVTAGTWGGTKKKKKCLKIETTLQSPL